MILMKKRKVKSTSAGVVRMKTRKRRIKKMKTQQQKTQLKMRSTQEIPPEQKMMKTKILKNPWKEIASLRLRIVVRSLVS
jgi:hypothetical protein